MIECISYTPLNKSTCLGIATLRVSKWGVTLSGITLHQKDDQRWVNFPARVIEEGGKVKYYPYISFDKKEHKTKFIELVKNAIDDYRTKISDDNYSMEEDIPF